MMGQVEPCDGYCHAGHGYGTQYQAQGKELPRIGTVRYRAHEEFAEGIGHSVHSQGYTKLALVYAKLG